ncbi:hypothetical protein Bca4012_048710 [Brassica carinata]|uniref:Uncharacterized protein n=1 Tax=Brassica carinata TaxID=52824 RepID=A0A8X7UHX2_BRACI|nr:hypothetical protein Bca52824_051615 [Brassica carinata]
MIERHIRTFSAEALRLSEVPTQTSLVLPVMEAQVPLTMEATVEATATDHNYAYTSTHYPVTTTATSVQLVTGNCSYLLQLLTGSCSLNSTEHISRSRKDKDSGNIFDDENKLTYAIPFKDNVYGFGDDGLRSITANCRGDSKTSSAVLCSLECEAKEEELMGIDMLLLNEKGVLRFVGMIKSTFSDHEQSAQWIMVDLQGDSSTIVRLSVFDAQSNQLHQTLITIFVLTHQLHVQHLADNKTLAVVVADFQDAEMERRLGVVVVADTQVAAVAVAPGVAVVAIYASVVMGAMFLWCEISGSNV